MATISMDPAQAKRYGQQIIQTSSTYNNEVKRIYSIIGDLKKAWTGTAAENFTNDIEKYKRDYEDFGKLINDFGELLVAIAKDYENIESSL